MVVHWRVECAFMFERYCFCKIKLDSQQRILVGLWGHSFSDRGLLYDLAAGISEGPEAFLFGDGRVE